MLTTAHFHHDVASPLRLSTADRSIAVMGLCSETGPDWRKYSVLAGRGDASSASRCLAHAHACRSRLGRLLFS
jgi:hypothetical protein